MGVRKFGFGDLLTVSLSPRELHDLCIAQRKREEQLELEFQELEKGAMDLENERIARRINIVNLQGKVEGATAQLEEVKAEDSRLVSENRAKSKKKVPLEKEIVNKTKHQEEEDTDLYCEKINQLIEKWEKLTLDWITKKGAGKVEEVQAIRRKHKNTNIFLRQRREQLEHNLARMNRPVIDEKAKRALWDCIPGADDSAMSYKFKRNRY